MSQSSFLASLLGLVPSKEYKARMVKPFSPPTITLQEIHNAVPKHLYEKSTLKSLYYTARDIFFAVLFYKLSFYIQPLTDYIAANGVYGVEIPALGVSAIKWSLWASYWFWESVALAGWWCLGHEAGHGTMSQYSSVNHIIGYGLHTFLLVPYYSWRSTHHAHHKATGSIERDENYVPRTRSDYGLPAESKATPLDYHEIFEETPIYSLLRIVFMQLLGWQAYLLTNALGSPMYPAGTNHFSPSSPLFRPQERPQIIASNMGLAIMSYILYQYFSSPTFYSLSTLTIPFGSLLAYLPTQLLSQIPSDILAKIPETLGSFTYNAGGVNAFLKLYFVPYLLANHWIVMLTFLHHSDPTIPHYRASEWSYLRGAVATVDRPLLGWIGRFFLHNVSHDHVAHHFFSTIPFYNQPYVTEHLKKVLKDEYNYDPGSSFYALYRSFTECCFIEDDGSIVFYKNQDGKQQRYLSQDVEEVLRTKGTTMGEKALEKQGLDVQGLPGQVIMTSGVAGAPQQPSLTQRGGKASH